MEKNHPIGDLMSTTMQKIREMVDVNTIIGTPIRTDDGITLIPVSKLSFGFASGGSDFMTKNQKPEADNAFGGGSGAGVNISPVAFLIVKGDTVKLLPWHHRREIPWIVWWSWCRKCSIRSLVIWRRIRKRIKTPFKFYTSVISVV